MSARSSLPPLLESFFRDRLVKQRNASVSTIASYRARLAHAHPVRRRSGRA